jgi:hypothetical protein
MFGENFGLFSIKCNCGNGSFSAEHSKRQKKVRSPLPKKIEIDFKTHFGHNSMNGKDQNIGNLLNGSFSDHKI